ncbi:GroES-like protein [Hanseniaspora valbyensis NRRL Y-1626]|uniref:GroES-like protein n=1 Tax=Hanseniaspora valbyensis NRRL Y-1626 TaxID=766949 RepID=A0A1B7TEA4_9ASCO|nr:GroES-like protein [Hanseniaspora valbyensis NRRL Y-1626]
MVTKMNALKISKDRTTVVEETSIPEFFLPNQILIKVKAVASNPTDWKHISYGIGPVGSTVGCDAAGIIIKLGRNETEQKFITDKFGYKVGDFITGVVHGASVLHPENGAFADYALLDSSICTKFTTKTTDGYEEGKKLGDIIESGSSIDSFEKAATLPVSLYTAVMVLIINLGKKLEFVDSSSEWQDANSTLLVYGGATAFALNLLQLNKLTKSFKNVVTIASSKHEKVLKSYGVTENFDYKIEGFLETIVKKYPNINVIIDAVSNENTFNDSYATAKKLYKNEKIKLINLMAWDNNKVPEDLRDVEKVDVGSTLLYCVLGLEVPFGPVTIPANEVYRKIAVENIPKLNKIVADGSLKCITIKINEKEGLEGAADAVEGIKLGKNRGEKFVARI